MITKHTVIYKLYPSAVSILEESTDDFKVVDKDGKSVTIDLSAINAEYAKQGYIDKRVAEYPSIADQLDDIYHNGIDAWKATIKKTKDKYPKS